MSSVHVTCRRCAQSRPDTPSGLLLGAAPAPLHPSPLLAPLRGGSGQRCRAQPPPLLRARRDKKVCRLATAIKATSEPPLLPSQHSTCPGKHDGSMTMQPRPTAITHIPPPLTRVARVQALLHVGRHVPDGQTQPRLRVGRCRAGAVRQHDVVQRGLARLQRGAHAFLTPQLLLGRGGRDARVLSGWQWQGCTLRGSRLTNTCTTLVPCAKIALQQCAASHRDGLPLEQQVAAGKRVHMRQLPAVRARQEVQRAVGGVGWRQGQPHRHLRWMVAAQILAGQAMALVQVVCMESTKHHKTRGRQAMQPE